MTRLADLPTLDQRPAQAVPKPVTGQDRIEKKRAYELAAGRFRAAVWLRDNATCRLCGKHVKRSGAQQWQEIGEVHHMRGRNVAPKDKCNPDRALLLCRPCHHAVTDKKATVTP